MSDKMFTDGVNIEYSGNFIVSNKQIFNQIQKAAPENKYIYMFNPEKMQAEIEKLSPVKHAYVRRFIFPARLTVMIQEEIPALVIAENENSLETAAYSFDGVFIGNEYMPLLRKGRAVKVLASKEQYDEYSKWDDKKIMQLYRLAETAERNSGEKVLYIDLRQQNNVLIQLESVKVRIGKLDYDVFERVKKLNSIMKSDEIKGLLERINFIDLSWSQVQYLNIDK